LPVPARLDEGGPPARCAVLVVGAGPAGSACARLLAQAGKSVCLVDAQVFPRDKTCGDGLIPDAFAALTELGLAERVQARMAPATDAYCQGPRGGALRVPGRLGVLRRRELDHLLLEGAREAGAIVVTPWRLSGLVERPSDQRVIGVRLRQGQQERQIEADWVVLATGASLEPLLLSGLCTRRTPSSMGARAYVYHPGLTVSDAELRFIWHPELSPGYAWIFPLGHGHFNVGVGLDGVDQRSRKSRGSSSGHQGNLRSLFERFCEVDPVARELKQNGAWEGDLKGAPMRCDLDGAQWHRAGLLLAGEALGSTFAFTGEGIGKALETGMAAARAILSSTAADDAEVMAHHAQSLQALQPRYRMYRKAAQFNRWPWMIDVAIWRARKSPRLIHLMSDVLAERRMPDSLLSWRGLKRLIWG